MAFLNSIASFIGAVTPSITKPDAMWHVLILNVFGWIKDYGWSIVVFTVLLKLVLSPLDFFQRYKMHKNQRITERLKPTMEKIQKQYGDDKQAFQQKQMELNRKEGYSYFSACLPMIVTLVVFITLWLSMQTVARYMMLRSYTQLYDAFDVAVTEINTVLDEKSELSADDKFEISRSFGQDVAYKLYYDGLDDKFIAELCAEYETKHGLGKIDAAAIGKIKNKDKVQASFLWIENIWLPDVPWNNSIQDWSNFKTSIDDYYKTGTNGLKGDKRNCLNETTYKNVMGKLLKNSDSHTNGFLILPVLVVLLSVGSQLLTTLQQKRAGQVNAKGGMATGMKVMMVIMPIMMAIFAIQYASIFTVYMVTNTATTLIFNVLFTNVIKLADKRKRSRNYGISTGSPRTITYKQSPIIHYVKGANPDAGKKPEATTTTQGSGAGEKAGGKKAKKSKTTTVTYQRSGRPDPNDLMGLDLSKDRTKKK
ncbi:MAG: membrane protein insertase YidC [Clostridiales bacterium]|nr:membrane protein insertase YidC [Clostridiales bacterium]